MLKSEKAKIKAKTVDDYRVEEYKICIASYFEHVKITILANAIIFSFNGILISLLSNLTSSFQIIPLAFLGISSLILVMFVSARDGEICEKALIRMKKLEKSLKFDFVDTIHGKERLFWPKWLYSQKNKLIIIIMDLIIIFIWIFLVIFTFFS